MSFFDDEDNDPFEDIVNSFFGRPQARNARRVIRRDKEEEESQSIEEEKDIYFIMELSGYKEEDIQVKVKDNSLIISARTSNDSSQKDYMASKHKEGITIQRAIPNNIKNKNFSKTFKNGVLEVVFYKK